jgi:hypothetical protein
LSLTVGEKCRQSADPFIELTFPNDDDGPTGIFERLPTMSVTGDIPVKLARSEGDVRSRPSPSGAVVAVPETAMNEHGDAKAWENDIGVAG